MEKRTSRPALEAAIESYLLANWYHYCCREFVMLCKVGGLKFIRDAVDPDDQERFATSFDELVALGCRPRVLGSALYFFHKSRIYDFPEEWEVERFGERLVPRYQSFMRLPDSKTVTKVRQKVEASIEAIEWLNDCGLSNILLKCVKPPQHYGRVLGTLRWYDHVLEMFSKPRSDVTESFAPIPCCHYPKIATGQFRFSQVSDLIECFGYRPDPKHQNARGKPESQLSYEPAFQSLERNFRNFRDGHGKTFESLRMQLTRDHASRQSERPKRFNWSAVFAPLNEYRAGNYRKFS
jgi:hypothetical protein